GRFVAPLRRLHPLHRFYVLKRPVRSPANGLQEECGQYPVPAVPHHRSEQPGLVVLRISEGGWDSDDGELHRGLPADSLHGRFPLLFPEKRRPLSQVLLGAAVLVVAFVYFSLWIPDAGLRLNQLGLFCSVFTISMYLSPLADLAQIIRTKSTKCLSMPLTITTFLTSTSWVLYGMQLNDAYIMVPNFPGIVTSLLRIWLFWRYPPGATVLPLPAGVRAQRGAPPYHVPEHADALYSGATLGTAMGPGALCLLGPSIYGALSLLGCSIHGVLSLLGPGALSLLGPSIHGALSLLGPFIHGAVSSGARGSV
ncbi:unnamed protein product, partial [Staurois parvus]